MKPEQLQAIQERMEGDWSISHHRADMTALIECLAELQIDADQMRRMKDAGFMVCVGDDERKVVYQHDDGDDSVGIPPHGWWQMDHEPLVAQIEALETELARVAMSHQEVDQRASDDSRRLDWLLERYNFGMMTETGTVVIEGTRESIDEAMARGPDTPQKAGGSRPRSRPWFRFVFVFLPTAELFRFRPGYPIEPKVVIQCGPSWYCAYRYVRERLALAHFRMQRSWCEGVVDPVEDIWCN